MRKISERRVDGHERDDEETRNTRDRKMDATNGKTDKNTSRIFGLISSGPMIGGTSSLSSKMQTRTHLETFSSSMQREEDRDTSSSSSSGCSERKKGKSFSLNLATYHSNALFYTDFRCDSRTRTRTCNPVFHQYLKQQEYFAVMTLMEKERG
jgi:hypothetical protein